MDEGHSLICGTTMSGKTTLAQILAEYYRQSHVCTIVLDPFKDPRWGTPCDGSDGREGIPETTGHFITSDSEEFLALAQNHETTQCALFCDESSESVGHYAGPMRWLATMSRHWGHKSHFITQAPQSLDPIIRQQCSQAFIFRVSKNAVKMLMEEFSCERLAEAATLAKGEFIYVARFGEPRRGRVDFVNRQIIWD